MPVKGMVHALKLVYGLLQPGGELIDFHPGWALPHFEVCTSDSCISAGVLLESDNAIEYLQASAALLRATANGWFARKAHWEFPFITKTQRPGELFDYLRAEWSDVANLENAAHRVQEVYTHTPGAREVRLVEPAQIGVYIRL